MAIETMLEILLSGSASAVLAVVLVIMYRKMNKDQETNLRKIAEKDKLVSELQEKRHTELKRRLRC